MSFPIHNDDKTITTLADAPCILFPGEPLVGGVNCDGQSGWPPSTCNAWANDYQFQNKLGRRLHPQCATAHVKQWLEKQTRSTREFSGYTVDARLEADEALAWMSDIIHAIGDQP